MMTTKFTTPEAVIGMPNFRSDTRQTVLSPSATYCSSPINQGTQPFDYNTANIHTVVAPVASWLGRGKFSPRGRPIQR